MSQLPPELPKQKSSKLAGVLITLVVVALAALFGQEATQWVLKRTLKRRADSSSSLGAAPANWETRKFAGLSIDTPFAFGPGPDVSKEFTPEVKALMERYEIVQGEDQSTGMMVTLAIIAYKPGVQVSLDGATTGTMNGAIKTVADRAGDKNPQFTLTPLTISDLPARRSNYSAHFQGMSVHFETILIQSGQQLWQVQMIRTRDDGKDAAKRILDSLKIESNAAETKPSGA